MQSICRWTQPDLPPAFFAHLSPAPVSLFCSMHPVPTTPQAVIDPAVHVRRPALFHPPLKGAGCSGHLFLSVSPFPARWRLVSPPGSVTMKTTHMRGETGKRRTETRRAVLAGRSRWTRPGPGLLQVRVVLASHAGGGHAAGVRPDDFTLDVR